MAREYALPLGCPSARNGGSVRSAKLSDSVFGVPRDDDIKRGTQSVCVHGGAGFCAKKRGRANEETGRQAVRPASKPAGKRDGRTERRASESAPLAFMARMRSESKQHQLLDVIVVVVVHTRCEICLFAFKKLNVPETNSWCKSNENSRELIVRVTTSVFRSPIGSFRQARKPLLTQQHTSLHLRILKKGQPGDFGVR